ncbi:unnamed protein product [Schistosoma rodhaini]|uniref:Protein CNPPD1 n=1 Tax=Schistosoma rodhaini TaxID=6188 RepID=A0AA85EUH3_9TREM|nr:unnamed protein product [Schistosoma rodhaini]
MDFIQNLRQSEAKRPSPTILEIFDVLCNNEGRDCFENPVVSDRIVKMVNSASKRRLGKLDTFMVLEYLCSRSVPPVSVLTALLFIEKLVVADPYSSLLTEVTAVDLFAVSMVVASKYLHDDDTDHGMYNAEWANEFDMELKELNELEVKFISALNWEFFVTRAQILQFGLEIGVFRQITKCDSFSDKPEFNVYSMLSHISQLFLKYSRHRTSPEIKKVSKILLVLVLAYLGIDQFYQCSLETKYADQNQTHLSAVVADQCLDNILSNMTQSDELTNVNSQNIEVCAKDLACRYHSQHESLSYSYSKETDPTIRMIGCPT